MAAHKTWMCICALGLLMSGLSSAKSYSRTDRQGALSVVVEVSNVSITTAETVLLTIDASAPAGWVLSIPAGAAELGGFSVLSADVSAPVISGGRSQYSTVYRLEPFLAGEYVIPSLRVSGISMFDPDADPVNVNTAEIELRVASVLSSAGEAPSMQAIAGDVDVPVGVSYRLVIGLSLCGFMLVVAWMVLTQTCPVELASSSESSSEAALQRLFALSNASVQDGPSACLAEANVVIHGFLAATFGLRSVPMVSAGSVERLFAVCEAMGSGDRQAVSTFFTDYDALRFSKDAEDPAVVRRVDDLVDELAKALASVKAAEVAA